jgi:hypothetical protein
VGHVDQGRTVVLAELARGVMPQVAGDIDVGVGGADGVEQEVTRTSAHRHPAYDPVRVTRYAHPAGRLGEDPGHRLGEVLQRRPVYRPDPAHTGLGDTRVGQLEDVVAGSS